MYRFSKSQAFKKLTELAKKPFDLTAPNALTPERIKKYISSGCGYRLIYGTERINDDCLNALKELCTEADAIRKMHDMQSGVVMNRIEGYPSESRSVLHTATRDLFDNPSTSEEAKKAANFAKLEIDKLEKFIHTITEEKHYTDLILIGIGGSELGPKANYQALRYLQRPGTHIYFLPNVDPDNAAEILKQCNLKRSLVLNISKSGNTLETLTNETLIKNSFLKAGLNPKEHFVAITSKGSQIDNKENYLEVFYLTDSVGGRYSSTSMVGGVLLAFAFGFSVFMEFLKGANAMDKLALDADIQTNLPLMAALLGIWNRNFLHHDTLAIIPYSQALDRYPAHIQQLDMESNGKHIDRLGNVVDFDTGPIIWGEPGTNAQHSFYQLIHQGTTIVPLEFIGFKRSQNEIDTEVQGTTSQEKLLANLFAQMIALSTGQSNENPNKEFSGNRPSHLLLAEQLTPFSLGALLSFYEHKTAFQGFIWNINSFDQEGVQLGKVLANKIIQQIITKNTGKTGESYPVGDAFLAL
jgi:glucose-6-phosphate isomerase